jgi:hypothetical protein
MGWRKAGTAARSFGKVEESHENKRQYKDTRANCMRVNVAGLSKALSMDLDEVFVRADDQYHITQSACVQEGKEVSQLSVKRSYPSCPTIKVKG